jgi:hypothetical protein
VPVPDRHWNWCICCVPVAQVQGSERIRGYKRAVAKRQVHIIAAIITVGVRPFRIPVHNDVQLDQLLPDHIATVEPVKYKWRIFPHLKPVIRSAHGLDVVDNRYLLL